MRLFPTRDPWATSLVEGAGNCPWTGRLAHRRCSVKTWVYLLSSLYAVPVAPWVRVLVVCWGRGSGGRPPEGEEEKEPFLGHVELAHPLPAPLLV